MELRTEKTLSVKSVDEDKRTFSGYLTTYGNMDRDGDVFLEGAFKTAVENRQMYPMLYNHDSNKIIGYLEATHTSKGVHVIGHLFDKTVSMDAERVYQSLKVGSLQEMSVGFGIEKPFAKHVATADDVDGLIFKQAYVREGSVVITPANPEARIDEVKAYRETIDGFVKHMTEEENITLEHRASLADFLEDTKKATVEVKLDVDKDKVDDLVKELTGEFKEKAQDLIDAEVVDSKEEEQETKKEMTEEERKQIIFEWSQNTNF